jgi:NhaA family Na+:H+ antiporter
LVGLEIKREILEGELSSFKNATLPIFAALGGMLVPAAIFYFFNQGSKYENGWGIPMATDIAFSLAIISMLGKEFLYLSKFF